MIRATDVFLSYKAEDRARLMPLISALEAEAFTVWWDSHISGGANWRDDILTHLDAAKCVIVAWTKRSVGPGGDFVRDEASRARRSGTYLPIRLDNVDPPLGFGEVQAISLRGWRGDRSDPRFKALADVIRRRIAGEDAGLPRSLDHRPRLSRRAVIAGGASAVTVAAAGGWLLLKPTPANAKRIAVLPFADLSPGGDQAYFSEGMAEELRAALSRIGLHVIGRNSCDAVKDLDLKVAARKLDVANLLTGSVRRTPQTIRVTSQLVNGNDGVERWARTYDRSPGDAIKIQTNIAENVAQALSIALGEAGLAALVLGGTADSRAQDLLLQARRLRDVPSAEAYRKGLSLAEEAISRDPNYADAQIARARNLTVLAASFSSSAAETDRLLAQADQSARRALAIAPRLGSAHAALSGVERTRLNFRASLEHLRNALALSPDDQDVLGSAAALLPFIGQGHEALLLVDRYVALDPLNSTAFLRKAQVLYYLRQFPQSIAAGRKALELAPKVSRSWIGNSLLLMNRPGDAASEYARMPKDNLFRKTGEALLMARTGDRAKAQRAIARMKEEFGDTANYQYAQIRAQLSQNDEAFEELDNALAARDPGLINVKVDPFIDPLRGDPRYDALLRKLSFP